MRLIHPLVAAIIIITEPVVSAAPRLPMPCRSGVWSCVPEQSEPCKLAGDQWIVSFIIRDCRK
jgi:hypothetical protein